MYKLLVVIHLIVCFFLIFIVLLQRGKGAEIGAAFGGSSQTIFGSRGAATFLNKLTTISAVVFMITSLVLAVISAKRTSVIQKTMPAKEAPVEQSGIPVKPSGPVQEIPQQPKK